MAELGGGVRVSPAGRRRGDGQPWRSSGAASPSSQERGQVPGAQVWHPGARARPWLASRSAAAAGVQERGRRVVAPGASAVLQRRRGVVPPGALAVLRALGCRQIRWSTFSISSPDPVLVAPVRALRRWAARESTFMVVVGEEVLRRWSAASAVVGGGRWCWRKEGARGR
jgi:hypothetical protein